MFSVSNPQLFSGLLMCRAADCVSVCSITFYTSVLLLNSLQEKPNTHLWKFKPLLLFWKCEPDFCCSACVCRTLELYTVILLIYILIPRDGNTINLPYIAYHREFISTGVLFIVFFFCVYWRSVSRVFFSCFFFCHGDCWKVWCLCLIRPHDMSEENAGHWLANSV